MTGYQEALSLLRGSLNKPSAEFRSGQWEAIDAIVNSREKLLVVERTGWGKSSVYFIATRLLRNQGRGPTLIVSPLLALMRNQIEGAARLGLRAATINSTNTFEWSHLEGEIRANRIDALLISPERLANEAFVQNVLLPIAQNVGLLVVDEAHCISDWGHDFRPDYRRLVNVLQRMPANVPILGTTATANNRVVDDIQQQLGQIRIQRGPLIRESLALDTLHLPTQAARMAWLAEMVPELPGTGIIYALTKRDAEQVARWLRLNGVDAEAYYSGVTHSDFTDSNAYREHLEARLYDNQLKVLVATTALSMGYDKPDLSFVIHYQAPGSIVAYYQQVGRAGRAIDRAFGILMTGREDEDIHDYFRHSAFPRERWVISILEALEASDGLTTRDLEEEINLRSGQINQVLKFLSVENPAPILKDGSIWYRTAVPYRMNVEKIRRLTAQREQEWREVQSYTLTDTCLMEYLARALDDEDPKPCGNCSKCLGETLLNSEYSLEKIVEAQRFLRHAEMPLETKKQVAANAFSVYGFPTNLPQPLRAETGRIMCRWGDSGFGRWVKEDKENNHFRDQLVSETAQMIVARWKPSPAPTWLTCIPSLNHTTLVPDFAERLAKELGIPFIPAIEKIRENQPQKEQENRFHRCRNLDGVFAVSRKIPSGPVLLIDDVVDSSWTLTVAAALLKRGGSGPVWPVALATSGVGN